MRNITSAIESLTNTITMYMVAVYALVAIVATSLLLSVVGALDFAPLALIGTLIVVLASTYLSSRLCAWTFGTQHNRASGLITSLILYLTVAPADTTTELFKLALVGCIASVSKYLLVWRGRHIFNPAALALACSSILGLGAALWWVATPLLLPVVMIAGVLLVAKTRRYAMVFAYITAALLMSAALAFVTHYPVLDALRLDVLSGPLVFFAAVMLTEPLTSPGTRTHQLWYGGLVGILYSAQLPWVSSPHIALLVGNIYSFVVRKSHGAIELKVVALQQIAPDIYELHATPLRPLAYQAGHYIELQLPHARQDSRGTRRVFSIATSPSEQTLRLATKLPPTRASSYKRAFAALSPGTLLRAAYVGGDFVLPRDTSIPVVWIAGGIGITPFRAMVATLLADRDTRSVTLIYCARTPGEFAYLSFFKRAARSLPLDIVTVITHPHTGKPQQLSHELLTHHIPDISRHHVYISGAPGMVHATRDLFTETYAPARVVTDYFNGY